MERTHELLIRYTQIENRLDNPTFWEFLFPWVESISKLKAEQSTLKISLQGVGLPKDYCTHDGILYRFEGATEEGIYLRRAAQWERVIIIGFKDFDKLNFFYLKEQP